MERVQRNYRVEWVDLGEGVHGDYNPQDPEDVSFLRFVLYEKKDEDWLTVEGGSFLSEMPISSSEEILQKGLQMILDNVCRAARQHGDIEDAARKMSLMAPDWFEEEEDSLY